MVPLNKDLPPMGDEEGEGEGEIPSWPSALDLTPPGSFDVALSTCPGGCSSFSKGCICEKCQEREMALEKLRVAGSFHLDALRTQYTHLTKEVKEEVREGVRNQVLAKVG